MVERRTTFLFLQNLNSTILNYNLGHFQKSFKLKKVGLNLLTWWFFYITNEKQTYLKQKNYLLPSA